MDKCAGNTGRRNLDSHSIYCIDCSKELNVGDYREVFELDSAATSQLPLVALNCNGETIPRVMNVKYLNTFVRKKKSRKRTRASVEFPRYSYHHIGDLEGDPWTRSTSGRSRPQIDTMLLGDRSTSAQFASGCPVQPHTQEHASRSGYLSSRLPRSI